MTCAPRKQALGWALLADAGQPLAAQVAGELGDLVNGGHLLALPVTGLPSCSTVASGPGGHHLATTSPERVHRARPGSRE